MSSYLFTPAAFPANRPRRLRRDEFTRNLVRENQLSAHDFIYPVFVHEGENRRQAIASMPGVERLSLDLLLPVAQECADLGIPYLALFPVIDAELKDPRGSEALNPNGLIPRVVRALKQAVPQLGIMTDVALDPYTSHGQDGVLDEEGYILNDITTDLLVQQALVQAEAGVDMVAPSDMMDGRIGAIRQALEAKGLIHTRIMAYSAKYASGLYGPFREAVDVQIANGGDRRGYQQDYRNRRESVREARLDVAEGADIVMVKPAMTYLDVVADLRASLDVPVAAYHVSGEYAMIKAAGERGWIDGEAVALEQLTAIRRAGADLVLTYFAKEIATVLS